MENDVTGLPGFARIAQRHWEEFRPKMVAHLKREGVYRAALVNADEQARATIADQVSRGNSMDNAKEMALSIYVLVRSEREEAILDPDSMPFSQPDPPTMWVPNLPLSRAAALAVPLDRPYSQAIYDKVVRLLEEAGEDHAKGIVGMYLEREEHLFIDLQFPEEWADQILSNDAVSVLVNSGDAENVEVADAELAKEALEENEEDMSLGTFLSMVPSDHGLD